MKMLVWLIKLIKMSNKKYSPTCLDRVNPEFIGIAQRQGSAKKNRLSLQKERNQLERILKYRVSVDKKLRKTLEQKRRELGKVQSVHQRHVNQLEEKQNREKKQRIRLLELNKTVQAFREDIKQNIRDANSRIERRNQSLKNYTLDQLKEKRQYLQSAQLNRLSQKRAQFKRVKNMERESLRTVNGFYRQKNLESLVSYKSQINSEEQKIQKYQKQIELFETTIQDYDSKIDKKKDKIYDYMEKISLYTMEPIMTQSRCLPLYLRDSPDNSFHSSRPSDILLKGARNIINKEDSFAIERYQ